MGTCLTAKVVNDIHINTVLAELCMYYVNVIKVWTLHYITSLWNNNNNKFIYGSYFGTICISWLMKRVFKTLLWHVLHSLHELAHIYHDQNSEKNMQIIEPSVDILYCKTLNGGH